MKNSTEKKISLYGYMIPLHRYNLSFSLYIYNLNVVPKWNTRPFYFFYDTQYPSFFYSNLTKILEIFFTYVKKITYFFFFFKSHGDKIILNFLIGTI